MKEKRKAWKENMSGYAPEKLVFLDESGINVNMTGFYARSKGGSRAVDAVPLWKPQNTTVLSSIQLNGETAYTTYSGGTTSEKFVDYTLPCRSLAPGQLDASFSLVLPMSLPPDVAKGMIVLPLKS